MKKSKTTHLGTIILTTVFVLFSACEVGPDENISKEPSYRYAVVQDLNKNISLEDMFFGNNNRSWAVAEEAEFYDPPNISTKPILLKTENLWSTYDSVDLLGENVNSIWFVDDQNGWIVGYEGLVLRSSDGGTSWVEYNLGTDTDLRYIWFEDSLHGWIQGGKIFQTEDGGETWFEYTDTYYSGKIFIDDSIGFGMNGSKLYKTQDGGTNWDLIHNFINPKIYSFWTVDGVNFLGCGDILMESVNGGVDWTIKNYDIKGTLRFLDENEGIAYWMNITWLTSDGGRSWKRVTVPYLSYFKDVVYLGPRDIWICGSNYIFHLEEE